MIDRIKMCHKSFGTQSTCNYELKPVAFHSENTANQSEAIPDTQTTTPSPVVVDAPKTNTVVTDLSDDMSHEAYQELKRPFLPTYESFYNSSYVQLPGSDLPEPVRDVVKRNKDNYEMNSKEIEEAVEEYEENRGVIDEWCNLAPESEADRLECISELEAAEPDHDNVQENVPDYSQQ
ncbi:uncharacterized protein AKAME5_002617300, partial [Lates japonicus]